MNRRKGPLPMTPNVTHGKASTYRNYACRCAPCTKANTERQRQDNATRRARLADVFGQLEHGTHATYVNWGCRCELCRKANTEAGKPRGAKYRAKLRRQRKLAKGIAS